MDDQNYTVEDLVTDPSFVRWVKGSDPQAQVFWENWKKQHPEKSAELQEARQLVVALYSFNKSNVAEANPQEINNSKSYIQRKILDQSAKSAKPRPARQLIPLTYLRAAVVTLLIASGLIFWWINSASNQLIYQTGYGETKSITLPDQSVVTLNANSSLRTVEIWQDDQPREVWLTGEAYFEVNHLAESHDKRFIVHTEVIDVQVLGTKFNLRQRRDQAEVVLAEGLVGGSHPKDDNPQETQTLRPGDRLQSQDKQLIISQVDTEKYSSWRNNRLYFEEQTLTEIAERLQDDYGLEVTFEESALAELEFTGSCPTDNLPLLYEALSVSLDLDIQQRDNSLLIRKSQK